MICKNCGNNTADDARFCTECGAVVENTPESAPAEEIAVEEVISEAAEYDASESAEEIVFSSEDSIDEEFISEEPSAEPVEENAEVSVEAEAAPEAKVPEKEEVSEAETQANESTSKNDSDKGAAATAKLTGGKIFGAVMVSVLAVIFLTAFNFIFSARIGLSGDIIENSTEKLRDETLLSYIVDDEDTVSEYIYDSLRADFFEQKGIEEKDVRAFLEEADFVEFASETLGKYASYIVDGSEKRPPSVTSEDIVKFVQENRNAAEREFGFVMHDGDYDQLAEALEDNGVIKALSVEEWGYEAGFYVGNLQFVFSFITIGMIFALVIVFFIWIAIILDKSGRHITGFFGNIALISGIILFVPSIAFVIGAAPIALYTSSALIYVCSKVLLPLVLVTLCTGAFEIIVGVIFKLFSRNFKKKEAKANGGK